MPINASSLLVGTERRRARRTAVATLHAEIPTSIQLTGFAIEVDPSPIWNWPHVRFGSKADICSAQRHVRFTLKSDIKCDKMECPLWAKSTHKIGALAPCSDVRLPPKADIGSQPRK